MTDHAPKCRTRPRVRTVVEVHELPDMKSLRQWASAHHVTVEHLGSTWEKPGEVYGARDGVQVRVCRTSQDRLPPVSWESPLEHLPTT
ncbi:hypothetical protein [Nocardiopsis sp. YSL2]|uniref:hypothetical protein n=1 Tax=Nocardiopsis sp. YSL2 TaxID=2939492 RepID=UPI0026F41AC6|nr:hypothetical protein [Nocardiopsis sp. YSL2]